MSYIDEDGTTYGNYLDFIESKLGLCGCRDGEIVDDIFSVLMHLGSGENHGHYYTNFPIEGPDKYKELILHILDSHRLLDHGVSIRGSWLSEEGREIVKRLGDDVDKV